jgi:membrane associated rhomboid family serine protease/TolA-binding protein
MDPDCTIQPCKDVDLDMAGIPSSPPQETAEPIWRSLPWSAIGIGLLLCVGFVLSQSASNVPQLDLDEGELNQKLADIETILDPMWEKLDPLVAEELLNESRTLGLERFLKRVAHREYKAVPSRLAAQVEVALEAIGLGDPPWTRILKTYGLVPVDHLAHTFLTHMFLHAGFFHLLISLLFLVPVALFLDRRWEPGLAAALFVASGLIGGLVHWIAESDSLAPAIGTAASISALIAALLPFVQDSWKTELLPAQGDLPAIPVLAPIAAWPLASFLTGQMMSEAAPVGLWGQLAGAAFGLVAAATVRSAELERRYVGVHRNLIGMVDRSSGPKGPVRSLDPNAPKREHLRDDWLSEKAAAEPEPEAPAAAPVPGGPSPPEEEARQALEKHDWATAHHWLVQVIEAQPQNVEALEGMVRACIALTRDEEAFAAGQKLLHILIKEGRREKAMVVFDRLLSKFGRHALDPTSINNLARFYENAARYERSIELYAQVAKSKGPDTLVQKAMLKFGQLCAYRTNDHHRAEQALRYLLQSFPDTPLRAEAIEILDFLKKPAVQKKQAPPPHGMLPD